MKTRTILSTLVALALAAPAFAQAQAPAPAGQATAPAPGPNTWEIDSNHSTAAFTVRHMMVSNVPGRFGKVTGTIQYDGKDVSSVVADVTIDATTISTQNEKRDAHLKSPDFFDVAQFPTITFKSKKVEKGPAGQFKLIGDLTIHGATKEVTLDVEGPTPTINAGPVTRVGASATTTINRQDFGVKWSRNIDGGGVVVGDTVKITLDIEAFKKNATPPSAQ